MGVCVRDKSPIDVGLEVAEVGVSETHLPATRDDPDGHDLLPAAMLARCEQKGGRLAMQDHSGGVRTFMVSSDCS